MTKASRRDPKPADGKSTGKYHYNPVGMAGKKAEATENCPAPDENESKPDLSKKATKSK
jgi:hypothetical protein